MDYRVVIPAAGSGRRMGEKINKLFLEINNVPIIAHTLSAFENDPACKGVVLSIKEEERNMFETFIDSFGFTKITDLVRGGSDRQESVYQGLMALNGGGIVLIHDGARPVISQQLIHSVAKAAAKDGAAVLAVPVKDTVKEVVQGKVDRTLDRSSLWAVQTPQAFRLSLIVQAHRLGINYKEDVTDDASLIELMGEAVTIVKGDYRNLKVTTPEDLVVAECFLSDIEKGRMV